MTKTRELFDFAGKALAQAQVKLLQDNFASPVEDKHSSRPCWRARTRETPEESCATEKAAVRVLPARGRWPARFPDWRNENKVDMAIASAPLACTSRASTRKSSRDGFCRMLPLRINPLDDAEAHTTLHQRRHTFECKVVKLRPILAADLDGVFKARGSNESYARAFALQQRVCADGGSVQQSHAAGSSDLRKRLGYGLRGIGRRGEDLDHAWPAALHPDAVGEGATGIDGNAERRLRSSGRIWAIVRAHDSAVESADFSTRSS